MPLSAAQIEEFKTVLLGEKARLMKELEVLGHKDEQGHYEANFPESGSNSDDDNAIELTEYADNMAIEQRLESELRDVEKALEAIAKGTYGICKYTGKDIDIRRLKARPTSLTSTDAKKALTGEM